VHHKVFGAGRVVNIEETRLVVDFISGGVKFFDPTAAADELSDVPHQEEGAKVMEMDDLKNAIREVLLEEGLVGAAPALAARWEGGEIVLKPGKPQLQEKTLPIDIFFHKVVMIRNQLRILEQNINSHKVLTDTEKADMQQYITRCYGSLTTFNALFAEKSDWFIGARGDAST
jgi:hypothetical protein